MSPEALRPDEYQDMLLLDVGSVLAAMRVDGVADAYASYQLLVLWLSYLFKVAGLHDRLATRRRPDEAPAEFVAHLRHCLREGRRYEDVLVGLWAELTHRGVPHNDVPGLLLDAADRVLALRLEREAFAAVGNDEA